MAKSKIDNESKELAITILKTKDIDPEEWLNEKYKEVITQNSKILIDCLKNSQI
ncbi:hypothetical protein HYI01_16865 [Clostridium botulinum]|uniref:Uncharacterized protein n=1 Tax=Clostridium botulinum TaxID=1491 RepID=A0A0A0UZF3_CLOBO|nr:hypothetical protein [Clostridium botulinum]CDH92474.1 conserved hypothetical protein [Clostridium botulinum B str. Eklund 17B (NRP)]AIW54488.1 hypothetical protein [Clostridium botulinum]AIW54542.1 hypothetical protein [Clostridium botulinum]ALP68987.1 hypothetical protein [Clostridium botulinum]MBY6977816.1 hypothetical protein [Clostridium botulinum]